jgi:hypothetical protein
VFRRNKLEHLSLASNFSQVDLFYNVRQPDGKPLALQRNIRKGTNALAYFVESVSDEEEKKFSNL